MSAIPSTNTWQRFFFIWASLILVIVSIYMAQTVLIPVVLAVLITFVLSPVVGILQRKGLGRVLSSLLVVVLAVSAVAGIVLTVFLQIGNLAAELPRHKDEIAQKIILLQSAGKGTWLDGVWETTAYIKKQIRAEEKQAEEKQAEQKPGEEKEVGSPKPQEPVPVTFEASNMPEYLKRVLSPAMEVLVETGLVIVLVAFMLIQRENLRNRFLHLLAEGSLTSATRAMDDATARISRFLLMQLVINCCFGVAITTGLYFIGVPYAILWGFMGATLRYIPYLGSLIAGSLPILVSIAILPGWLQPVLVGVYILALELVCGNVLEPMLFGQSIGVSEVALLVAAAFWAWLWGPIGLMLSTPLTACLVVLGRYVPSFSFFQVLLGDTPVLEDSVVYYQRLLARDAYEATELVEARVKSHSPEDTLEAVLLPALVLAQENRDRGELTADDEEFIFQVTRTVIDDLFEPPNPRDAIGTNGSSNGEAKDAILVLGFPARDEADELALEMFGRLPSGAPFQFDIASSKLLFAEMTTKIKESNPAVVFVATLSIAGLPRVRYLCKRVRAVSKEVKIIVGCWGGLGQDIEQIRKQLQDAGADQVGVSFSESLNQLTPLIQFLVHSPADVAKIN